MLQCFIYKRSSLLKYGLSKRKTVLIKLVHNVAKRSRSFTEHCNSIGLLLSTEIILAEAGVIRVGISKMRRLFICLLVSYSFAALFKMKFFESSTGETSGLISAPALSMSQIYNLSKHSVR